MSYQEEKQVRIRRHITRQAISLAMQGRWQESIAVNKQLIENFPNDVEAYNRVGKAYMELGDYAQAKEAYAQALQLDQYNLIAKKNLQRLERLGGVATAIGSSDKAEPTIFIEETGKAGVVNLHQSAPVEVLVRMTAGDKVSLKVNDSTLSVENGRGEYLGQVPAKIAQRLIKLIQKGNKYTAAVISSTEKSISVIIKEIYQDPSQVGQISFPSRRLEELQPYVSERIFRHELEEEEELAEAAEVFGEAEVEVPGEISEEAPGDKPKWEEA